MLVEPHQMKYIKPILSLVFALLAVVVVVGCGQEEQATNESVSTSDTTVEVGPGNRVDANFQSVDPE